MNNLLEMIVAINTDTDEEHIIVKNEVLAYIADELPMYNMSKQAKSCFFQLENIEKRD